MVDFAGAKSFITISKQSIGGHQGGFLKLKLKRHICERNSLWPLVQAIPLACCAVSAETGMIFFSNSKFTKLWNLERFGDQLAKREFKYTDYIRHCLTLVQDASKFGEICNNNNNNLPNEAGGSQEDMIHRYLGG